MFDQRSFDIVFSDSAEADLVPMDHSTARQALVSLFRLRNVDILSWKPVPTPAGREGAWVLVPLGDHIAMAQWDEGAPELWSVDAGRGTLKVVRIVPSGYPLDVLREALAEHSSADD